jgi:putative oxidoreductase
MSNQTYAETAITPSAIPSAVTPLVPALGRVMISPLFILAGLSKLGAPAMTIGYIQSVGLPLPSLAYGIATFIEIVGGITLLLGYRTRIVAGVLFVFTLATAVFFHNHFGDQNQFIHFFKNVAIAGGLLHVIAFGGGRVSLDGRRS